MSHALGLPIDLEFGTVLGGPGATILLLGGPNPPFRPLLELSWAPLVAPSPLWAPFGAHYGASERTSCCAGIPSKVWVLAHLGTARVPLYSSGGASGAHSASSWALWSTPEALLGTSSALLERGRCNFGVFLIDLAFGPMSVLQGRGRDVRSVHAGACFVRVRQIQQDSLLRQLWGTRTPKIEAKRAREKHERVPSNTGEPGCNAKSCPSPPQRTLKKRDMKTQYFRRKTSPRRENVNNHIGKHQITKSISRPLHVPHQSASKRTTAPQTAP